MLVNITNYMCIICVNYNAKNLNYGQPQPQKWLLGVILGEMKLHDNMTTDMLPRCATET